MNNLDSKGQVNEKFTLALERAGDNVRQLQKMIVGWHNHGDLHYYILKKDFEKAKQVIDEKADIFLQTTFKLVKDSYDPYDPFLYLLKQQLLNDAWLYEYPLYDFVYLQEFRRDVFNRHRNDYITLYDWTSASLENYFKQWIEDEISRVKQLIEKISLDYSVIVNEKVSAKGMLAEFINALKFQLTARQDQPSLSPEKLSYLGYVLLHHYWYKHTNDPTKAITETTKKRWSKYYGIKERELWKKFCEVADSGRDPGPSPNHNSKKEFQKQYELILPMLEQVCPSAYTEISEKLQRLNRN